MTPDEARALLGLTGAFTSAELAAAYRDASREAGEQELRRLGEARDVLRRRLLAASADQQWARTATIPIQVVAPDPRPSVEDRVDSPTFVEGLPAPDAGSARTGAVPVVTVAPSAAPRRRRWSGRGARAGLTVSLVAVLIALVAGGVAALTTPRTGSTSAEGEPSTAATGVQVEAPAEATFTVADGPSNACSGGEDCWAWRVTADAACRSASADLTLSSSADGDAVRTRHLGVGAFHTGVARTVTIPAERGDPAFAALSVRCDAR